MPEQKAKIEVAEKAHAEPKNSVSLVDLQRVFEERNKKLNDAFNSETNIANRYDIRTRMEELSVIFNEVVRLVQE